MNRSLGGATPAVRPKFLGGLKLVFHGMKPRKRLFGGKGSYGNGAAMRVAPVGLLYHDDFDKLRSVAYAQSIITHAHELGIEGAILQAFAVTLAVKEDPLKGLEAHAFLEKLLTLTNSQVYMEKLEAALNFLDGKPSRREVAGKLGNSVEAYNSVPTAIYCFLLNHESFKEAVAYAVSLDGDRDTVAVVRITMLQPYRKCG